MRSRYRGILSITCYSLTVAVVLLLTASSAYATKKDVARVEQSFMEGRYDAVVSEAERLIKSRSGQADELYYLKGLSELKLGRFDAARESFKYIISKRPGSKKTFDAYLGVGDSYMLAGALNDAVGIYVGMLDNFRSDKNLPVVYSRLASCYKGLGVKDKAEYYSSMAEQAAPLGFEAKAASAIAAARPAAPKPSAPVSNIQPRDQEDIDLVMATGAVFSVQVGSFKNRKNAEKLAQKLAASGYDSRVEIPVVQGEKFYRVKVGRASSKGEVEALRARLMAAGYTTKICDGAIRR